MLLRRAASPDGGWGGLDAQRGLPGSWKWKPPDRSGRVCQRGVNTQGSRIQEADWIADCGIVPMLVVSHHLKDSSVYLSGGRAPCRCLFSL